MFVHIFRDNRINHAVLSSKRHVRRKNIRRAVCAVNLSQQAQRRDSDIQCDKCLRAVIGAFDVLERDYGYPPHDNHDKFVSHR